MVSARKPGVGRLGLEAEARRVSVVGRIGPLAFALGVGAALATGHGVASAEPSSTSGSPAGSSSRSSAVSVRSDSGSRTSATSGSVRSPVRFHLRCRHAIATADRSPRIRGDRGDCASASPEPGPRRGGPGNRTAHGAIGGSGTGVGAELSNVDRQCRRCGGTGAPSAFPPAGDRSRGGVRYCSQPAFGCCH